MKRREFLKGSAAAGIAVTVGGFAALRHSAGSKAGADSAAALPRLTPPAEGMIPVAFPISEDVQVIDFAGPWEVLQDVMLKGGHSDKGMDHRMPFELFTVAETMEAVIATGGLKIVPDYTFANAPAPKVIVVAAQQGSKALHAWLKKVAASPDSDLVASVCTGAFQLAESGLLSGKPATTHHLFQTALKKSYPDIDVKNGLRFVETGKFATAGGLTSGMDLALRVVERYYGRAIAKQTAEYMEYQSTSWIV
jgi:transcriptional regulator GlxA family with amidase domain